MAKESEVWEIQGLNVELQVNVENVTAVAFPILHTPRGVLYLCRN